MPQLIVQDFAPQLIWLAITFATLYFIMAKLAIPKIAAAIEQRHSKIADDLDMAQSLKHQTEKAIASHEASMAEARSKANAIVQDIRDNIGAEIQAEQSKADAEIAARTSAAEVRIAKARDEAMSEVHDVAKSVAGDIVSRFTGSKPGASTIAKALAKAADKG